MGNRIAVVILNFNGAEMLRAFLPSVVDYSPEAEVIVADNCSTDASAQVMREEFPAVRYIQLEKNYGFADGYNRALSQVEAEYFLLLNSDVEVTQGWLAPMLEYMDSHPGVAACQPKLLSYKNKKEFEYAGACGGFIDKYGYPYCRGRIFDTVEEDKGQYDSVAELFWATGAALMIRAEDYRAAGGLDGTFFAHMEEIDLCWRLRSRGRGIVCIPQSCVYHVGGATLNKSNPRKTYLNFRNNLLMLYKNLPENELRHVMFVRALLDYVAAFKSLLSGDAAGCRAVLQARRDFRRIKHDYSDLRRENLEKCEEADVKERASFSILWKYYAGGRRLFSEL
ncbi:MAG: glycosyltransferase family 2 protein [Bacteroidaceae bacterium]|nr:glycosyltransferase family 2 protein [Bacteroidaceae bacterium]